MGRKCQSVFRQANFARGAEALNSSSMKRTVWRRRRPCRSGACGPTPRPRKPFTSLTVLTPRKSTQLDNNLRRPNSPPLLACCPPSPAGRRCAESMGQYEVAECVVRGFDRTGRITLQALRRMRGTIARQMIATDISRAAFDFSQASDPGLKRSASVSVLVVELIRLPAPLWSVSRPGSASSSAPRNRPWPRQCASRSAP
jgi:hypothetical protein